MWSRGLRRMVWDHDFAGSNPAIPTNIPPYSNWDRGEPKEHVLKYRIRVRLPVGVQIMEEWESGLFQCS